MQRRYKCHNTFIGTALIWAHCSHWNGSELLLNKEALKSMLQWEALTFDVVLVCYQTSQALWHPVWHPATFGIMTPTPDGAWRVQFPGRQIQMAIQIPSLGTRLWLCEKFSTLSTASKVKCYLYWWICTLGQRHAERDPGRKCGSQDIPLRSLAWLQLKLIYHLCARNCAIYVAHPGH